MTLKNQQTIMSIIRLAFGIILAILLYQLAMLHATADCQTLQASVRYGGHMTALKILFCLIILSCLGMPTAISGLLAGLLLGPFIGGPFASLAVLVSSVFLWALGKQIRHIAWANNLMDRYMVSREWFQRAMSLHTTSGFHWVVSQSVIAKVPIPLFALMIGAKIKHLTLASMVAGIFAASVFYIAGYALAGSSIGCAVVNHALDVSFEQYKTPTLISCIVLLILSQVQSYLKGKTES